MAAAATAATTAIREPNLVEIKDPTIISTPAATVQNMPILGSELAKPDQPAWADTPFPLIATTRAHERADLPADHSCRKVAREMACIHNTIIRSLNAAYNQAPFVKAGTQAAADFIEYNKALYSFLLHHHEVEENHLFPDLEKLTGVPNFCERDRNQHAGFVTGAEAYGNYIGSVTRDTFDGRYLQALIDRFGPGLQEHLVDEIQMLLDLGKYDSQAVAKAMADSGKIAVGTLDPQTHTPLVLGCQDASFTIDGAKAVLPLPWFLPYLVKYHFGRKYAGSWKFSPADYWGRRVALLS